MTRPRTGVGDPDVSEEIQDSASSLVETLVGSLPRLGAALGIIVVGYLVSRLVRVALRHLLRRRETPSFAKVMSKVGGWTLLAIVVLIAVALTFPSVKPVDVLASLGFFSLAVGFAFQDILENTLAGILLLFRQPFVSGDQIEVDGRRGTVEGITIRETQIRAFDGEQIIIPNRDVYKGVIVVATRADQRRQEVTVGIAYENDPTEAVDVIENAVREVEGVDDEPSPLALIGELGVSTVDIDVLFWSDPRRLEGRATRSDVIAAVKRALEDAGIEMPADILALQATPSLQAAIQGDREVTPGGAVRWDGSHRPAEHPDTP